MKKIILMTLLVVSSVFADTNSINNNLLSKAKISQNSIIQSKAGTFSQCVAFCIEQQGGLCRFAPDPEACLVQQQACVQDCLGN
ncbi:MAG: hypothetical protein JKY19_14035 [Alcanivoracaceae bacterium]|nr:hypothetical protein [Alcanivoracaceae bacterium]